MFDLSHYSKFRSETHHIVVNTLVLTLLSSHCYCVVTLTNSSQNKNHAITNALAVISTSNDNPHAFVSLVSSFISALHYIFVSPLLQTWIANSLWEQQMTLVPISPLILLAIKGARPLMLLLWWSRVPNL